MLSPKPRGLYAISSAVITIGFIDGASIAAGTDRPLY
jgi:hypothetical protein